MEKKAKHKVMRTVLAMAGLWPLGIAGSAFGGDQIQFSRKAPLPPSATLLEENNSRSFQSLDRDSSLGGVFESPSSPALPQNLPAPNTRLPEQTRRHRSPEKETGRFLTVDELLNPRSSKIDSGKELTKEKFDTEKPQKAGRSFLGGDQEPEFSTLSRPNAKEPLKFSPSSPISFSVGVTPEVKPQNSLTPSTDVFSSSLGSSEALAASERTKELKRTQMENFRQLMEPPEVVKSKPLTDPINLPVDTTRDQLNPITGSLLAPRYVDSRDPLALSHSAGVPGTGSKLFDEINARSPSVSAIATPSAVSRSEGPPRPRATATLLPIPKRHF